MKFSDLLKKSYKSLFDNKIKWLALLLILIASVCFGLVTVISFTSMPDSVKELPVAIINRDNGVAEDGKNANYGDEVVRNALDSENVNFVQLDSDAFDNGIENTSYYIGFVIPEDFSKNVLSAANGSPEQPEIEYFSDMRKNFIISMVARNIKNEFLSSVSQSISSKYAASTYNSLYSIKGSMHEAADGSKTLTDGISSLQNGVSDLKLGSYEINSGMNTLSEHLSEVSIPEITLTDAQKQEIHDAAADSPEIAATSEKLTACIAEGVSASIKSNLDSSKSSVSEAVLNNSDIQNMVKVLVSSGYYSEEQAEALIYGIVSTTIDGANAQISEGNIGTAISYSVKDSLQQVSGNSAISGAEAVTENVNIRLSKFEESLSELSGAVVNLNDGTEKLSSGISTLYGGTGMLLSGSENLTDALSDGAESLDVKLVNTSDEMAEFISEPVGTKEKIYGELSSYAQGFAPLFMSLGIWIGCLILLFAFPARLRNISGLSSPKVVFAGYLKLAPIVVFAALLIVTGAFVIGIDPAMPLELWLFVVFCALVFLSISECLNLMFNMGGNIIGIILTIFQIPACSGSFPSDLMPSFFHNIAPYLPLTYSIDGFREIISGGDLSGLMGNVWPLLGFFAVFLCISLATCRFFERKSQAIYRAING